jgi:formyl-CoA transferase
MPVLEGLRIPDTTQYEAATSYTQALMWLGADVVKVESPTAGPGRGATGDNEYFAVWNSSKRRIAIDLRLGIICVPLSPGSIGPVRAT